MTQEQKQYVEQNIDLIEEERWEEFFQTAPEGMGAYLYHAGIDFMSSIKEAPRWCFAESDIYSVTIPDTVTKISTGAFDDCRSLTSITIPDSVTSIALVLLTGVQALKVLLFPTA